MLHLQTFEVIKKSLSRVGIGEEDEQGPANQEWGSKREAGWGQVWTSRGGDKFRLEFMKIYIL